MEPPVFPTTLDLQEAQGGESQEKVLLEVLNHCKVLHEAVQRLEQKLDNLQSNHCIADGCKNQAVSREYQVGTGQLSWSLVQRLGPSPQTNHRWYPPWKRSPAPQTSDNTDPVQAGQCSITTSARPCGVQGKAKRKGRCKGARKESNPQQPGAEELQPKQESPTIEVSTQKESQPAKVLKKGPHLDMVMKKLKKHMKRSADPLDEMSVKLDDMPPPGEDKKVLIGSAKRKVWIPTSVYMKAFKEVEPQKAMVPVLNALFPISTLSCSAITSNPLRDIQQLDPNKLEALREWLSEMYPQHDMSVRGLAWAQCLGVINSITKDLRRRKEKFGHVEVDLDFRS